MKKEEESKELLKQQAAFVANNPGPVLRTDWDGKVILCNPASKQIFKEDITGKSILSIFPALRNTSSDKLPDILPFKFEDIIGEKVFLFTLVKHKPTLSLFIYGSDITEQKELERIKASLVQMIIHDLNNPLMILFWNLQLLERDAQKILLDEHKAQLHSALNKIQEMKDMISDLLDIERIEEGKLNLKFEKIDIYVFIKEIVDSMSILAKQENKNIFEKIAPSIPLLVADQNILRRIITNLIGNALKFTPAGSIVEIIVDYNKEHKEIIIGVKDHGEGIPRQYQEMIFEKFAQIEVRQLKDKPGKGLGLTFCKMAVEAHGGRIWVESEVGKGSIFYFTMPLKD
jgi:signal transduction histidine kinase